MEKMVWVSWEGVKDGNQSDARVGIGPRGKTLYGGEKGERWL